jgi:hypothetical protein
MHVSIVCSVSFPPWVLRKAVIFPVTVVGGTRLWICAPESLFTAGQHLLS